MPANATTSASESISASHGRRRAPRRLDQAVGRERALDRPQPFQHRAHGFRQAERQQRPEQQRRDNGQHVASVEHRPGLARDQAGGREQSPATPRARSCGAGFRRPKGSDTGPSAAPGPDPHARHCAPESLRPRGSSRRRWQAPAQHDGFVANVLGLLRDAIEVPRPVRRSPRRSPRAIKTPSTSPAIDPSSPMAALSPRKSHRICPRVAPSARRMPISERRCVTAIANEL